MKTPRVAAYLAAGVMVAGGVVGIAGPASAHHNTVTATVRCATTQPAQGDVYDITVTVANSEDRPETITASSRPNAIPVGTVLGNRAVRTFTERVTTPQTITYTVTGRWTNGVVTTNSGTLAASAFPHGCKPPQPEAQRQTREHDVTNCKADTVTTILEARTRNVDVWDVDTQAWTPGPWTAWTEYDRTVRDATNAECKPELRKTHIRVRTIDKCNCFGDSVKAFGGRHAHVKVTRLSRLRWNVRAVADKGWVLPRRINGSAGYARVQNYLVTLTNKPCDGAGTPGPHPNLPDTHCRTTRKGGC